MSRFGIHWRKVGKYFTLLSLLLVLAFSGLLWYVRTDSFQQMVRGRLISSIERAAGARVELGSFHVVPLRLQVEVRDLTIHGREAAGEPPYAHVDSMVAIIHLSSALGARLGFRSLVLQHPVVHIIFYPDGSTNQPTPSQKRAPDPEQLFSLSARRLEVQHGELLLQNQRIPLDFSSNDVSASLIYSFLHLRYSGNLEIGKAETHFDGMRPVAWSGQSSFTLDRNGIQIQSLNARSGGSRLQASGVFVNFRDNTIKGNYDLTVDLAQAAAVTRQQQLKAGIVHLAGSGFWSRETFGVSGGFGVRSLAWQDKAFSGRALSANGRFSLDPRTLALTKVEGQLLRGSFTADAEIVNWQSPPKAARNQEQQGTIRIRTKDLSLSEILAGLGPEFRPLHKLKFAGNVTGSVDVRWKQSIRSAETKVQADVFPPPRVQPGEIPLSASAQANYDSRSADLEISDFSANTPATQIHASGDLTSSVKLSFAANDLREWQPVISQVFPAGSPLVVHGRAAFNGTATAESSSFRLAGNLQLQDFDALISAKAGPKQPVHWDSVNADVQLSSTSLALHNAVLHHGGATVKMDGAAALVAWNLMPESPLRFRIDVQNADASEIAAITGYGSQVTGKLSAAFELSGSSLKLQGQGSVSLTDGTIRSEAFDSANAFVALSGTQLSFKDLRVSQGEARLTGAGDYDLSSGSLHLNLRGTNFDLAGIAPLEHSRIKTTGKLDFTARASGTTAEPEVTADLHLRNLTLNQELVGDFLLQAVSHGTDLGLTGHSDSKNAQLLIGGNVHLRDQWPAHIDFHFTHLDVDPFLESYLRGHITGHSAVAGDLVLDGPLRSPQQLQIAGNLTDLYTEVEKVKLRNEGPIHFLLSDRAFKLENFHVLGENTDFSGSGSLQLGDRTLDFEGHGKLDLKLIQNYAPDLTSSGSLTGEARVTGTLDAPLVEGKLQIQNGAISDINLPSVLSDINGTLLFNQNQVTIESLNARTGGGTVAFTGRAELVGRQVNFDLTANADSVRLRYPPGVSSTANAELRWTGGSSGSVLSGDITVTKLGFTPGFDFGAYLERSAQVSSLPQTDPMLNKIRLDLHVATTPELQMQTSVIRLQGAADLRVRGSAAKPIAVGRADVFEGEAYFNGTKYRLERGGITFSNPAITTPFLDLEAVTRVRDYDVTLSLTGDVSKPNGLKLNYRSDPPLPTSDIIALLAFGQTTEESAQLQQTSQSAFNQQASSALLAAALNATLNNRAQRLFGNSRIKIDPQGLESETSTTQSGPAVTIEQQVKDNLTLSYTTNVAQTSQQVIRAEYNLSKNVSIVAIRDQNGVVSFDVKIRRRKR